MELASSALKEMASKLQLPQSQVSAVLELLLKEECTIPFIVRYRKERTGGLDEVVVRQINDLHEEIQEREKRRAFILDTIKKMEAMTPDLERLILEATTIQQLEDIYAPYKSKRKTKAQVAREKGLEPLAELILTTALSWNEIESKEAPRFVPGPNQDVANVADAISGAGDIIIEKFSHHPETKEKLRQAYWEEALIVSSKKEDAEQIKDHQKYQDFFDHKEPIKGLKSPKTSHRYLAMRRGQKLKILKVEIEHNSEYAINVIQHQFFPPSLKSKGAENPHWQFLHKCAERAFQFYIHPSLDVEIKTDLKNFADTAAIEVFGRNLKNLLLAPYLGSKTVMGVDPGIRTGCKIVVIDSTGKLLIDQVIFPFAPHNDIEGSKNIVEILLNHFNIQYVAIGNGTNGRETLSFFKGHVPSVKEGKVNVTMISEAGASIYSASDLAREEFPDKDPTVRGAISIARRFQDPLAELVKIDPKSIGVGQYQHDVNQTQLKKSLTGVVESCVNYVGVDINTASSSLLSYISGMNKTLSKNLVQYREECGGLKNRDQLLSVPRFTSKVFQQCAGFLRIYDGENPLDATFIHPEQYSILTQWAKDHQIELSDLVKNSQLSDQLLNDENLQASLGEMTLQDIVLSLRAPSQDPRKAFESVEFTSGIHSLEDVKVGQLVKGVVNNITMFGAFIDIGIKEQGLVHISELSQNYVDNAFEVLQVGQEVEVRVLNVDLERKRLSLSCRTQQDRHSIPIRSHGHNKERRTETRREDNRGKTEQAKTSSQTSQRKEKDMNQQKGGHGHKNKNASRELPNRPFAILKDLKLP